jgi:hypothetical protein
MAAPLSRRSRIDARLRKGNKGGATQAGYRRCRGWNSTVPKLTLGFFTNRINAMKAFYSDSLGSISYLKRT